MSELPLAQSAADRWVCKGLCIPEEKKSGAERQAYRLFNAAMLLSALRCLLTYVVLPVLSPLIGATTNVGATVGIPLAAIALVFDVRSIRRFWLVEHRWRWPMAALYAVVMALATSLLVSNIVSVS